MDFEVHLSCSKITPIRKGPIVWVSENKFLSCHAYPIWSYDKDSKKRVLWDHCAVSWFEARAILRMAVPNWSGDMGIVWRWGSSLVKKLRRVQCGIIRLSSSFYCLFFKPQAASEVKHGTLLARKMMLWFEYRFHNQKPRLETKTIAEYVHYVAAHNFIYF